MAGGLPIHTFQTTYRHLAATTTVNTWCAMACKEKGHDSKPTIECTSTSHKAHVKLYGEVGVVSEYGGCHHENL